MIKEHLQQKNRKLQGKECSEAATNTMGENGGSRIEDGSGIGDEELDPLFLMSYMVTQRQRRIGGVSCIRVLDPKM